MHPSVVSSRLSRVSSSPRLLIPLPFIVLLPASIYTGTNRISSSTGYPAPLALVHTLLTKSRNVDVQLAACLCAADILRSMPPGSHSTSSSSSSYSFTSPLTSYSTSTSPASYASSYPSSSSYSTTSTSVHTSTATAASHRPFVDPAFPSYLTNPNPPPPPAPSSSYASGHHHHHPSAHHAGYGAFGAGGAYGAAGGYVAIPGYAQGASYGGPGVYGATPSYGNHTGTGGGAGQTGGSGSGGSTNAFDYAQSGYAASPLEDACVRAVVGVFTKVVGGPGVNEAGMKGGGGEKDMERRVRGCYVLCEYPFLLESPF